MKVIKPYDENKRRVQFAIFDGDYTEELEIDDKFIEELAEKMSSISGISYSFCYDSIVSIIKS